MQAFSIEFLRKARKELASLPPNVQKRIATEIEALKTNPRPPGVKVLKDGEGRLRLRVGDYRVIYRVEDDRLIIVVVKIGHRKNVYK